MYVPYRNPHLWTNLNQILHSTLFWPGSGFRLGFDLKFQPLGVPNLKGVHPFTVKEAKFGNILKTKVVIGVGFKLKFYFWPFLTPRGTQFNEWVHSLWRRQNLETVLKPKLFIGVGFHTKILFMTFLAPKGTQFIGGPPIHCEGGKIGKKF
jgi:hypothetical protein